MFETISISSAEYPRGPVFRRTTQSTYLPKYFQKTENISGNKLNKAEERLKTNQCSPLNLCRRLSSSAYPAHHEPQHAGHQPQSNEAVKKFRRPFEHREHHRRADHPRCDGANESAGNRRRPVESFPHEIAYDSQDLEGKIAHETCDQYRDQHLADLDLGTEDTDAQRIQYIEREGTDHPAISRRGV